MSHEDLALPYVLGALSPVEREALSRARLYDRSLERAIARCERRMAAQSLPGVRTAPPMELWRRIASALCEERALLAGKRIEAFADGSWTPIDPGIEAKQVGGQNVWLLRCNSGQTIHQRPSTALEHVLIVAGDVHIGSRCFSTGDYLSISAQDKHSDFRTSGGCILLMF